MYPQPNVSYSSLPLSVTVIKHDELGDMFFQYNKHFTHFNVF